jgi:hypothetical protein
VTDAPRIQPSYLKTPTVQLLPDILEELRTGALRIPPFQREFVWSEEQRLHLLDSVRHGLPTGSLMVWRTSYVLQQETQIGPFRLPPPKTSSFQYLLDGRQRMTTLFAALAAGLWTRLEEEAPVAEGALLADDETPWEIAYDLSEESFCTLDPETKLQAETDPQAPLLPLRLVLDDYAYDEWRTRRRLTRSLSHRASALRAAFQSYPVAVVPLATDDLATVTLTFKRVNASGTPMSDLHMARALSWSEEFDLTEHLEGVREQLESVGWARLDMEVILSIVAAGSGEDSFSYDVEKLATKLRSGAGSANVSRPPAIDGAIAALREGAGLFASMGFAGPSTVPSQRATVLVGVAFLQLAEAGRLTAEARATLRAWLARVLLQDRLGGAPPHVRRAMLSELRRQLGLEPSAKNTRQGRGGQECRKFSMAWARSRVVAAVLADQGPLAVDGSRLAASSLLAQHGSEAIPRLMSPNALGIPARIAAQLAAWGRSAQALQHPANRLITPPKQAEALRALLLEGEPSEELLRSHLITPDSLRRLRAGEFALFFEDRRKAIHQAELAWAKKQGVQEFSITQGAKLSA